MPCSVKWNKDGWICTTQMNSFRFPEEMTHCWFNNCQGRSPRPIQIETQKLKLKLPVTKPVASSICSYVNCNKTQAANRKYCSDICRKRQARKAYKMRNRKT